jgi:hypothetical protein
MHLPYPRVTQHYYNDALLKNNPRTTFPTNKVNLMDGCGAYSPPVQPVCIAVRVPQEQNSRNFYLSPLPLSRPYGEYDAENSDPGVHCCDVVQKSRVHVTESEKQRKLYDPDEGPDDKA